MIKQIEKIEEINGVNSPLIPRIFVAYKYKSGSDNAWRQIDDENNTIALISSVDGNFTLIATEQTNIEEIEEFLLFLGCNSLISNVKLTSSAKSYSLFKFSGDENISALRQAREAYYYGRGKRQLMKTSAALLKDIESRHGDNIALIHKGYIYIFSKENVLITVFKNESIPL